MIKYILITLFAIAALLLFGIAGYLVYLNRPADQWGWFLFSGLLVIGGIIYNEKD
jgi:hypothetical protein